jgi:hypothetical protein
VIQGGTIVTTVDLADPATAVVRYDADLPVTPPADTYYIVRVRGATPMHPVASGVPYALTNPIWVDVP